MFLKSPSKSKEGSTRQDTMTGTPGSIVERKNLTNGPQMALRNISLHRQSEYFRVSRNACDNASLKRSRAKYGNIRTCTSLFRPTLVDLVTRDLYIPEKGIVKTYVNPPFERATTVVRRENVHLIGQRPGEPKVPRLWLDPPTCRRYLNVNHEFTFMNQGSSWSKCLAQNFKAFGPISRNRHYRFLIKLVTFFGMNQRDLRNLLRVRDLWLRGSRRFRKAVFGLIWSFPHEMREYVRRLPRKPVFDASTGRTRSAYQFSRYTVASVSPLVIPTGMWS